MGCLPRTPLVHEDQRLTHFAKALQAKINKALCGGGDTLDVQWTNFLFVDQNDPGPGPAPTGERNYWTDKFETIQSAVNAAQTGDVIYINPGTYQEDLDLSNIADNVTIMGSGEHDTIIQNATDTDATINCQPTSTLVGLSLKNLYILNSEGNQAVLVDCTNALTSFPSLSLVGMLTIDDCYIVSSMESGHALDLRYVNTALLNQLIIIENVAEGGISLVNCGSVECFDSVVGEEINADYNTGGTEPSGGKDSYRFYRLSAKDDIVLSNQANVQIHEGSVIEGAIRGTIVQSSNSPDDLPFIKCNGLISSVNIEFDSTDEYTGALVGVFDHAEIQGNFIFNSANTNTTSDWLVRARNAVFLTTVADTIQCDANTVATANGNFDMLGSEFHQAALDTNNNGVNRTFHYINNASIPADTPTQILVQPPYISTITADTDYTVHPELVDNDASFPFPGISLKNPGNFTVQVAVGEPGTFKFKLIMHTVS